MPSVALPGSSNNVSPVWLCIAPYKTKEENAGGGQAKLIFVKFPDGNVVPYESIKGCARSLGISPDVIYCHMNKPWKKNNHMGIQFTDNIDMLNSLPIISVANNNNTKPSVKRKRKATVNRKRNYKLVAKYKGGKMVYCYSVLDASAKTGVDRRTITKYTNKRWTDKNKHGIQFETITN